jgi:hypothetical protein
MIAAFPKNTIRTSGVEAEAKKEGAVQGVGAVAEIVTEDDVREAGTGDLVDPKTMVFPAVNYLFSLPINL